MALALLQAKKAKFAKRLAAMSDTERRAFVYAARDENRWPPASWWLRDHAAKHGQGRSIPAFCRWAEEVKKRSGILIYAYVHSTRANEGVAFYDPTEGLLVWVNTEYGYNMSIVEVDEILKRQLEQEDGFYWRVVDLEMIDGTRT